MEQTEFLIVGAGPYSLATMFLRSGPDWHLDAREVATFEAYARERGLTSVETKPLPLDTFLDYASWFMGQYNVAPRNAYVTHLARSGVAYIATLDDGSRLSANKVLLGLGFSFFKHYPTEVVAILPPRSYSHTCDTVDFDFYRNKRVLIVGGRQSAFEWAALIREHGAEEIHLTYRHASPQFVAGLVLGAANGPAYARRPRLVAASRR